ncbi:MAG: ribbon-helix-helix protein, CopG family [Nanoarchaeota archaeon]|nr:ribbon-helix-helix protein, CopG family [Nanoarchaeota archaeon]MBU1974641.1 ribbon-helix-helix protein, CopG family [Nanoarchaeota archaeon]
MKQKIMLQEKIHISLPKQDKEALEEIAGEKRISLSSVVRMAMLEYVERVKNEDT